MASAAVSKMQVAKKQCAPRQRNWVVSPCDFVISMCSPWACLQNFTNSNLRKEPRRWKTSKRQPARPPWSEDVRRNCRTATLAWLLALMTWAQNETKGTWSSVKNVKTRKGWHSFCWYLLISLLMMTCKLNHTSTSSKLKNTRIVWTRSKCTITFWIMGCQGTR